MDNSGQICFAICACVTISQIKQIRIPRGLYFWNPAIGSTGKHQTLLCSSCAYSVLISLTEPQCRAVKALQRGSSGSVTSGSSTQMQALLGALIMQGRLSTRLGIASYAH